MDIGSMIQKTRMDRGLSQVDLATKVHCTKQAISNYESGARQPSYDMLERIAEALSVPVRFFISDTERDEVMKEVLFKTYNKDSEQGVMSTVEMELITELRKLNAVGQAAALSAIKGLQLTFGKEAKE